MVTRGPSQVRVAGPLAPHADGFRAALDARGFSPWSQMFYLHLLADLSRWLGRHGLDASGLTDANASAFRRDRRSRARARVQLIDEDHTNPQREWVQMGSPEYPSRRQLRALLNQGHDRR